MGFDNAIVFGQPFVERREQIGETSDSLRRHWHLGTVQHESL